KPNSFSWAGWWQAFTSTKRLLKRSCWLWKTLRVSSHWLVPRERRQSLWVDRIHLRLPSLQAEQPLAVPFAVPEFDLVLYCVEERQRELALLLLERGQVLSLNAIHAAVALHLELSLPLLTAFLKRDHPRLSLQQEKLRAVLWKSPEPSVWRLLLPELR